MRPARPKALSTHLKISRAGSSLFLSQIHMTQPSSAMTTSREPMLRAISQTDRVVTAGCIRSGLFARGGRNSRKLWPRSLEIELQPRHRAGLGILHLHLLELALAVDLLGFRGPEFLQ